MMSKARSTFAQKTQQVLQASLFSKSSTVRKIATVQGKTDMFCFQCEQTKEHKGCTVVGNCGKTPETAALQDLLVHAIKGLSIYAHHAKATLGLEIPQEINHFTVKSVFSTLTNVNFDSHRFVDMLKEASKHKNTLASMCKEDTKLNLSPESQWLYQGETLEQLVEAGKQVGVLSRKTFGDDVVGMQELITYGLKGMCAYAEHAVVLGREDPAVFNFVYEAFSFLTTQDAHELGNLVTIAMRVGQTNLRVLELLDEAENDRFGQPTPTQVRTTPVKGKCILVSGHDYQDLEDILKQTEGKGINVYTHGELLPAHSYPKLKQYKHLVGNYGGPWQLQKMEFSNFPGSIVMTTNCLIEPRRSYKNRIFTHGVVGWEGVHHIENRDFSPAIQMALESEGFTETDEKEENLTVGFGHKTVISVADKVVDAIKSGDVKRFFVIGGCDGAESERNYYKNLASILPKEAVILTLGCGKYRFNKQDFGTIGNSGIPRMLDMGQCNDTFSAVKVALALADVFKTDVNSLPLSIVLSWFEQKAVAVLLTLLSLGMKNIRIGPALPAFATPNMLNLLQQEFNLMPIQDPKEDLAKMMNSQ